MISSPQNKRIFNNRARQVIRILHGLNLALLLGCISLSAFAQMKPASSKVKQSSRNIRQPEPKLPATIQIANGQTLAVSELVPQTEAATKQLEQVLASIHNPEIQQAESSLQELNKNISETAEATKKEIRLAGSPLQLTDVKITWTRHHDNLEAINKVILGYASSLDQQNQQLGKMREIWTAVATSVGAAKLPNQFVQGVLGVQTQINVAEEALRPKIDGLVQIQVQISQARNQIDDVIDLLNVTDTALRDQIFVIDSPPIWRVLHVSDLRDSWQQITRRVEGTGSHTKRFYQVYRSRLLGFGLASLGLFAVVFAFSRQDRSEWPADHSAQIESLRHPIALTGFVMLLVFGLVFAKAPAEVLRISRIFMVITVLFLASGIFGKKLRVYAVALGLFSVANVASLLLASGTLLRRLFVMFLASTMLTVMYILLRKKGVGRTLLKERHWSLVPVFCYVCCALLFTSVISNTVGNVSFSDVLANGTILVVYCAVAAYVFYVVFTALAFAFTASKLAHESRAIRLHRGLVNQRFAEAFRRAAWVLWVALVLYSFQILSQTISQLKSILYYRQQIGAISISVLDLVLFGLVLYVSTIFAKLIRFLLDEEFLPRTSIDSGAAQAGSRLTYTGLLIVGVFIAFGASGLELSKLTVLTGALGVGLGFGLQNVVNNFVSGVIVSLERPVKVGDLIEVDLLCGEIRRIGFRSSTVRTFDGADVIVPNSELISKNVVNWTLTDSNRRAEITVGAAYGTAPDRVLAVLHEIVSAHPEVRVEPAPLITFDKIGDNAFLFTVRFWSKLDSWLRVRSDLNEQIAREFSKRGIDIPLPQREVHLHMEGAPPPTELSSLTTALTPATLDPVGVGVDSRKAFTPSLTPRQ
jgi:potassium-dependent mechanosensitive channel